MPLWRGPMIPNPDDTEKQILKPLSKMTTTNKSQYIADVKVMNYLLQAIPNDIYNSVDACKNAKEMWERIKRLMFGSDVTSHVRHSRLMDEFDKFAAKEGELLESVYERLTTLVNIMDRNNVRPILVSINTKFLNCLQPEWSKYVTMVRHNQTRDTVSYDVLYDSLVQFEPHVLASKAKKAAKNHDPLALLVHSNASSSQSHANSSYSPQPYYVTHPSSVVDYEDEYQGELQGDSQEDKLTTAMMLLARAITQKFSTPTNNRLRTSSNTRNQAVVQDGRVDIQTKNTGYGGNGNRNAGRQNRNQAFNAGNGNDDSNQIVQRVPRTESTLGKANVQCYNCNEKGHYARDCQKPRVRDAKYFREQMLLAMKDEAGSILKDEENDFLLDNSYGEETMEELTVAVMLMARIQPADGNTETVPSYDAKAVSEVNASSKARSHVQESDSDSAFTLIKEKPQLERELRDDKNTIERILKEKDKIQSDFFKIENEKIIIQHETQLAKKAFKERENRYLEDIVDLEEKLSSHDRIVYKMGQSIQTIHMLGKKPNKVYDPFLKAGLGYKNLERLKKAIAAQPKMYDGEMLHSAKVNIDSPDSEKILEDAEEKFSVEQTYFSIPSTSNNGSESKEVTSDLPIPKMPKESKLLKMFDKMGVAINGLRTRIDKTLLEDRQRRWMSDSQNSLREFYKTDVIPMSASLSKNLKELKEELIEEVQEMLNIFESMEQKVNGKSSKENILQNEIDRLLENQDLLITISELKNKLQTVDKGKTVITKFEKSETSGTLLCVTPLPKSIEVKAKKVSTTKVNTDMSKTVTSHLTPKNEQSQKHNENVLARGMYRITKTETQTPDSKTNMNVCNSTGVKSSNSVRRQKSKDTKSKDRVLKNKNDKRPSAHVRKMSSSVSIDSNKRETMHSNVCQSNASVLSTKTVNAVNDGSNIVCVSCGKDVFLLSHEKCVARYALSRNSSVKRALFTTPIAAKSKNLGATSVVAKSRLSVAKTTTATNKVSSVLPLSSDSSQSRTLSNYMKNKIATSRKWQKWFENQQCFNWTPKSKTAQSLPSETKSRIRVIQLVLWIVDSGCSKHMTGNLQLLRNFVEKFMGTIRFGNDHFAAITGYGDYVQGNLTICHVYYVEGLGHNLFSVGQFCDGDLEVAFRSNTCYVRNLEGDDLLTGSCDSNLYTISSFKMVASSPVC
ncbi:retrovirus-related pol polyprotein from transposon TNT 1-94 [Tanacetum coccineum]